MNYLYAGASSTFCKSHNAIRWLESAAHAGAALSWATNSVEAQRKRTRTESSQSAVLSLLQNCAHPIITDYQEEPLPTPDLHALLTYIKVWMKFWWMWWWWWDVPGKGMAFCRPSGGEWRQRCRWCHLCAIITILQCIQHVRLMNRIDNIQSAKRLLGICVFHPNTATLCHYFNYSQINRYCSYEEEVEIWKAWGNWIHEAQSVLYPREGEREHEREHTLQTSGYIPPEEGQNFPLERSGTSLRFGSRTKTFEHWQDSFLDTSYD